MNWMTLLGFVSLLLPFSCVGGTVAVLQDGLVVKTTQGLVRGFYADGYRVFRGLPYAAPPIADLRWRPPRPHPPWTSVLNTTDFGPSCLQPPDWGWATINLSRMSEDCLTLNVYTPRLDSKANGLPVMVYLHAGEFHMGSSNDEENKWPFFGPEHDIVLVTFNVRLGIFGQLALHELRNRALNNGTGNYGFLDQRFAMRWVQENIAVFGGDPGRITIFGESSGGTSVAYHLVNKDSWPFFQRAILESPGLSQVKTWDDAQLNAKFVVAALAALNSPNCTMAKGSFSPYVDCVICSASKVILHSAYNLSLAEAKGWCNSTPGCWAFTMNHATNQTQFVAQPVQQGPPRTDAPSISICDNFDQGTPKGIQTSYLRPGPDGDDAVKCFLAADAELLNSLTTTTARDDSFNTDAWAPVIDQVDLPERIEESIARGHLAPHADVLLGSNLDEGTVFMGEVPPGMKCTSKKADFEDWAAKFFGTELGATVVPLYETLIQPTPICNLSHPEHKARWYWSAMRSAGDFAILCPVRRLARALTNRTNKHGIYIYFFKATPTFSKNYQDVATLGAFHGAEVPFVWGDQFELLSPAERNLSKTMGCLWRSFAISGDPNGHGHNSGVGKCGLAQAWPAFTADNDSYLQLSSDGTQPISKLQEAQCDLFSRQMDDLSWRPELTPLETLALDPLLV